jgi:hypothetical protein
MTELQEQNQDISQHIQDVPPLDEIESTSATVDTSQEDKVRVEEFKISGNELVTKVKDLIHQGNIRRIILKTEEGNTLIEIPLTVGVVGGVVSAALFPIVAALGVIGALVTHLTVVIEKKVTN